MPKQRLFLRMREDIRKSTSISDVSIRAVSQYQEYPTTLSAVSDNAIAASAFSETTLLPSVLNVTLTLKGYYLKNIFYEHLKSQQY
jgi:hypothetical protein